MGESANAGIAVSFFCGVAIPQTQGTYKFTSTHYYKLTSKLGKEYTHHSRRPSRQIQNFVQ